MNESKTHYAELERSEQTFQVIYNNEVILESDQAIKLVEYNNGKEYLPVVYFPRSSGSKLELKRTNHVTHCPIKGDASYWSYQGAENGIWSYENPLPDVNQIQDHFAFDQNKGFQIKPKGN